MPAEPSGTSRSRDTLSGRTGLIAVVGEEAGVGRAQQVEVQVQRDVVELIAVQTEHVVHDAVEPVLVGSPEHEAHRVVHRRQRTQLQRGFQHRGHPGAIVVDARTVTRAVQMRADHDHLVRRAGFGLRQHVSRGDLDGSRRPAPDRIGAVARASAPAP